MTNDIMKGLLKLTQDIAKLALEVEVAKHRPVVLVETRPRTIFDELFAPPVQRYVEVTRPGPRKCSSNTPWQVCEDRNCFYHRNADERDMSKLR